MFLAMLNKKEQENFIELAAIGMHSDGKVDANELDAIEVYRRETGLNEYKIQGLEEKDLVTSFKASTKKVRRSVIIELAGVLYADKDVSIEEQEWIQRIGIEMGFRASEIRKMVRWTKDFNDLLEEGYEIILK